MPIKEVLQDEIEFIQDEIVSIVKVAWAKWLEQGEAGFTARGRANLVWEFMRAEAQRVFADNGLVHIIEEPQTVSYLVKDKYLFRFKKGSANGVSANYPTQLALAYHDHEVDLLGLPEVQRVEVVYVLDKPLEASIHDVLVVARDGDNVVWCHSLLREADNIAILPVDDVGAETEVRTVKVRAKGVVPGGKSEGRK
ncbi:MAG: hypothetical protein KUG56_03905 [Kordiimonadaceae bacterium]|nr:hypothetical protein [Kordiimonadaceae bacterium]